MDYNLTSTSVTISPLETSYTVSMTIIDDEISESETEAVILTFEKYNSDLDIEFNPTSLTLVIRDDDGMCGCTQMNCDCIIDLISSHFQCSFMASQQLRLQ